MGPGPDPPPGVGSVIGPFRLVAGIGAGGMGTVYRAERADGGFAQQVAVKIIGTPVSHAGAARRFRAERQILASLRHPHIVSLMDGGVTPDGHAYLVMEYVDGVPIAAYCAEHALALHGASPTVSPRVLGGALRASPRRGPPRSQAGEHSCHA